MAAKVEFRGLDRLREAFDAFTEKVEDEAVTAAEDAAAAVFRQEIQAAAPRRTGQAAASVEIVESRSRDRLAISTPAGARTARLFVGPTKRKGFYLFFVDQGWKWTKGRRKRTGEPRAHSHSGTTAYKTIPGTFWFQKAVSGAMDRARAAYQKVFEQKTKEISERLS
jgi:hypothetical protein